MWTALTFPLVPGFRRIMGYEHFWILTVADDERTRHSQLADHASAG